MRSSAGVLHAYVMIRMTDLCGAKEKGSCGLLAFCFCLAHCCANLRQRARERDRSDAGTRGYGLRSARVVFCFFGLVSFCSFDSEIFFCLCDFERVFMC
jgi:hypothetical protein